MINLKISSSFREKWPTIKLACLECDVVVEKFNHLLWSRIDVLSADLRKNKQIEDISKTPAIAASRKAYKALGKDPARYRLSAEALMRRVIKGYDLYQINNVVDSINLASFTSGFSIGAYDADKLQGEIELGTGRVNELYEGIGRGELNIEFLSILRDQKGAFGSPTSDSLRTSVNKETNRLILVYFGFGAHNELDTAVDFCEKLLIDYAHAQNIERYTVE
ncbi:MAG: phenylalanine--tRNA ligase beta subunit-related protein [Prolixibacteraceae bacterium]|jgi:DNA/RNA-binding domain of Phe-tRNA-synthetase-like protein|nr:phenylalanine--tRNA ligase beta subunit-related protein [Prolixibacteraceae bacterium]